MDRFDLEQEIMNCWSVVEDIGSLIKVHNLRSVSEDELQNALLGIKTLYQLKFESLFDTFEQLIKDKKVI